MWNGRSRVRLIRVFMAMAVAVLVTMPATAQASTSGYSDCSLHDICFWTGDDGTGSMCHWTDDDPDWQGGAVRCSWSNSRTAQSVFNNGTSGAGVSYYTGANYSG